jgi:small conductance mechanosensitive channel
MLQFDPTDIANFAQDEALARRYIDMAGQFAVNLVTALLILLFTLWLSGKLSKLIKRRMAATGRRRRVDLTLANFIASLVRYLVVIVGLIAVLGQLGVQTTSILAVLGAASIAVGLALQGTLSNVAAGVMLLFLRPYRVNDYVEINGRQGTVRSLDLFTTELVTGDGLKLIMPNGKVFGEMIINFNTLGTRRMQPNFVIDHQDDIDLAMATMMRLAAEDERVLKDPAPWAGVTALTDHGVQVTLRAWTTAAVVGDVESEMIHKVKDAFTAEGLRFPYPHQVGVTREEFADIMRTAPRSKPTTDSTPA